MPRPNQPRSIASEQSLARRIAFEREARNMSYEGLAVQMKHVGCPINASALFRIEKGDPPRRITVDELMAFAEVFALPVENLLMPPEVAAQERLMGLLTDWELARRKASQAEQEAQEAQDALRAYVMQNPDVQPALERALTSWVEHTFDEDNRPSALEIWMWNLTRDADWGMRAKAAIDAVVEIRQA